MDIKGRHTVSGGGHQIVPACTHQGAAVPGSAVSQGAIILHLKFIQVDFQANSSTGQHPFKFKIKVNKDVAFRVVVIATVQNWLHQRALSIDNDPVFVSDSDVQTTVSRVKSVTCNGCDCVDEMGNPDSTLGDLNSDCTPTSK